MRGEGESEGISRGMVPFISEAMKDPGRRAQRVALNEASTNEQEQGWFLWFTFLGVHTTDSYS